MSSILGNTKLYSAGERLMKALGPTFSTTTDSNKSGIGKNVLKSLNNLSNSLCNTERIPDYGAFLSAVSSLGDDSPFFNELDNETDAEASSRVRSFQAAVKKLFSSEAFVNFLGEISRLLEKLPKMAQPLFGKL